MTAGRVLKAYFRPMQILDLSAAAVLEALEALADPARAASSQRYFKTGPGQYGAGDQFLGVAVPVQRQVARTFQGLAEDEVEALICSPYHECRLTGLIIWVNQAAKVRTPDAERQDLFERYLRLRPFVNNWDLVDTSAPTLVGGWLLRRPVAERVLLDELAAEPHLWSQRIAVIATQAFIRQGQFDDTLRLATSLLSHRHDLMHKAVGWMLREIGDRDEAVLTDFLAQHAARMPRTMLRYAIEKRPAAERQVWLAWKSES